MSSKDQVKDSVNPGATISHYLILSRLGGGGMGEVFLAEDTRLGRKVALKLLRPDLTKDETRLRRFEQEARAASALNHPNILTIYDVEQKGAAHFIVTEFVEGNTLRERLQSAQMDLMEILDVAIQTSNALSAAHVAGIVHRDIKPDNIMLRPDGYIKVLDFGVAKLTEQFTEQNSKDAIGSTQMPGVDTEPGIVMGSPGYMSPEQVRGLEVDGRTDIFSLGVMLYEMLARRRPFDGPTQADLIGAILYREPPPLADFLPTVPARLQNIVSRALAKDRQQRYQTSKEMLADLRKQKRRLEFEAGLEPSLMPGLDDDLMSATSGARGSSERGSSERASSESALLPATRSEDARTVRITSAFAPIATRLTSLRRNALIFLAALAVAVAVIIYFGRSNRPEKINSLAVLPFANASADPNTEYLSDGITESLINNLSQSSDLKVMSRNSVFRYKGRDADARAVGRELGVRAVLVGGLRQQGEELFVNIELIDARDNSRIWGAQYSRRMSDILAVQEDIARQISQKLQLTLTSKEEKQLTRRYTQNTEAYHLYLQGRYYWNKRREEGLKRGIEYFNQAIEKDRSYALAYAGLADCYALLGEYSALPPQEAYPKAKQAAIKALELDDSLAEAHTSLAAVNEYDWDWTGAEKEYKRAIEINPNYAQAHHWYSAFLAGMGRIDESMREIKLAQELDPLSLIINTAAGRTLYCARQYDQAIEQFRKTIDMEPNFAEAHFHLGLAYEQKRAYDEAVAEFQKAVALFDDKAMKAWIGRVEAVAGKKSKAEESLKEMDALSKQQYISPYTIAMIYAGLGEKDLAIEWLEKVYKERSYYVVWLKVDPIWNDFRSDPRFIALLDRIGLPQ